MGGINVNWIEFLRIDLSGLISAFRKLSKELVRFVRDDSTEGESVTLNLTVIDPKQLLGWFAKKVFWLVPVRDKIENLPFIELLNAVTLKLAILEEGSFLLKVLKGEKTYWSGSNV